MHMLRYESVIDGCMTQQKLSKRTSTSGTLQQLCGGTGTRNAHFKSSQHSRIYTYKTTLKEQNDSGWSKTCQCLKTFLKCHIIYLLKINLNSLVLIGRPVCSIHFKSNNARAPTLCSCSHLDLCSSNSHTLQTLKCLAQKKPNGSHQRDRVARLLDFRSVRVRLKVRRVNRQQSSAAAVSLPHFLNPSRSRVFRAVIPSPRQIKLITHFLSRIRQFPSLH